MSNNTAGLSVADAWEEALKEESMSVEESVEADTSTPDELPVADDEQPAVEEVEEEEEKGLFSDLDDEAEDEQPESQDSYEVTVDGEKLNVTLDELKNGYMRQADYTRKTQELSQESAEVKDAVTLFRALQENPMQTVQKLWETVRQGQPVTDSVPKKATQSPSEVDIDALVEQKLNERLAEDPRLRELEEQRVLAEINAVFDGLEKDYDVTLSEDDRIYVLGKAEKMGVTTIEGLEAVFAKLMHDVERKRKQAQNVQANSTATGYGGKDAASVEPKENVRYSSFRDAMNETLAEERMSSDDLTAVISNL